MARTRYASDPGLIARMGATMFLLGLVFVGLVVGLFYRARHLRQPARRRRRQRDRLRRPGRLIGIGAAFASYYWSDKIALRTSGARLVSPRRPDAARLHGIVDRLCALADMPKPRVAIAPTPMPNAFATGRNSKIAVLCVDRGPAGQAGRRRGARGRARARDVARGAQGRRGDDDRLVPRHHRRAAGQVRVLRRAVRRRRPRPRRQQQQQRRRAAGHADRDGWSASWSTRSASC